MTDPCLFKNAYWKNAEIKCFTWLRFCLGLVKDYTKDYTKLKIFLCNVKDDIKVIPDPYLFKNSY